MATFKDLSSLMQHLQKQINESLGDNVRDHAADKLKEGYDEEVYSYDYNASRAIDRRMSLTNDSNIVGDVSDNGTLTVQHNASPAESVFGQSLYGEEEGLLPLWIEEGNIPNVFNDNDYPWTKPRPVFANTREEMKSTGSHVDALKSGLEKRGLTVKKTK